MKNKERGTIKSPPFHDFIKTMSFSICRLFKSVPEQEGNAHFVTVENLAPGDRLAKQFGGQELRLFQFRCTVIHARSVLFPA